jgi:hypothetical protein
MHVLVAGYCCPCSWLVVSGKTTSHLFVLSSFSLFTLGFIARYHLSPVSSLYLSLLCSYISRIMLFLPIISLGSLPWLDHIISTSTISVRKLPLDILHFVHSVQSILRDMEPEEDVNTSKRPTGSQLVVSLLAAPPVPVNEDIRSYFYVDDDESADNEPWTTKPDVPTPEEVMGVDILDDGEDSIQLAANIVVGPWRSKGDYLRTHYELLREDAVAPLRDAVAYIRDDPQMMDSGSVAIYEKV